MQIELKDFKLKMVEGIEMDDSQYNKETKQFIKTGNKVQMYGYSFISNDPLKEKFYFLSKKDCRDFEDKAVDILVSLEYDDYSRKTKVTFDGVLPHDQKSTSPKN